MVSYHIHLWKVKKKRKEKTNSIQFNVISFLRSNDTQVLKILL